MTSNQPDHYSSPLFSEIDQVSRWIEQLFGSTPEGERLVKRCREAQSEVQAIATMRGLDVVPIAIIGSKNVGKSWVCRRLIRSEANRERIPSGERHKDSTSVALWIGPDAPAELPSGFETWLPLAKEEMIDLGKPYVLLDLPGYNDLGVENRQAALHAIHGIPFRVLVISSQTLQDESQFAYLQESDGTTLLPLLIDHHYPSLKNDGIADVVELKGRIERYCPLANVLEPVIIPHAGHSAGDEAQHLELADETLVRAFRSMLEAPVRSPAIAGQVSFARFRREISRDLRRWMAGITPAYRELVEEEAKLVTDLMGGMIGSDTQLRFGISMKMRMLAVAKTPGLFFPFRTILGVLALTAGAWDRMAMALAGSLPSLALLAFQTARNLAKMEELKSRAKEALKERVENLAREKLSTRNEVFIRSLKSYLPSHREKIGEKAFRTRLEGLDELSEKSAAIFDTNVERYSLAKPFLIASGGLATLLFFGLGAGPLWAVYREFIEAWNKAFAAEAPASWPAFPAPSGGMIFATLLLMLLPVFLLALITVARSTPRRKVEKAIADTKAQHEALLARLTSSKQVRLVSDDPTREAVRGLLDFMETSRADSTLPA